MAVAACKGLAARSAQATNTWWLAITVSSHWTPAPPHTVATRVWQPMPNSDVLTSQSEQAGIYKAKQPSLVEQCTGPPHTR